MGLKITGVHGYNAMEETSSISLRSALSLTLSAGVPHSRTRYHLASTSPHAQLFQPTPPPHLSTSTLAALTPCAVQYSAKSGFHSTFQLASNFNPQSPQQPSSFIQVYSVCTSALLSHAQQKAFNAWVRIRQNGQYGFWHAGQDWRSINEDDDLALVRAEKKQQRRREGRSER